MANKCGDCRFFEGKSCSARTGSFYSSSSACTSSFGGSADLFDGKKCGGCKFFTGKGCTTKSGSFSSYSTACSSSYAPN